MFIYGVMFQRKFCKAPEGVSAEVSERISGGIPGAIS